MNNEQEAVPSTSRQADQREAVPVPSTSRQADQREAAPVPSTSRQAKAAPSGGQAGAPSKKKKADIEALAEVGLDYEETVFSGTKAYSHMLSKFMDWKRELVRKIRTRGRNRVAAQRSRARKKNYLVKLRASVARKRAARMRAQEENVRLRQEHLDWTEAIRELQESLDEAIRAREAGEEVPPEEEEDEQQGDQEDDQEEEESGQQEPLCLLGEEHDCLLHDQAPLGSPEHEAARLFSEEDLGILRNLCGLD